MKGTPMDAGCDVFKMAASRDGKWIVSGTWDGRVMVWDAESHKKVTEFKGHSGWVSAIDVSPDGTRILTSSVDKTACVWSLSTGKRLIGPLKHDDFVAAAKFSPDGCLIAVATYQQDCGCILVYNSQNGHLLADLPIKVKPTRNTSLVWANDAKQLFTLSRDGIIHCFDVSTGTTLSKWRIHSRVCPQCITLGSNGTFVAASAGRSVSFWSISKIGRAHV